MSLGLIEVLGANSSGNTYILKFEDGVNFQFDAGKKNRDCENINKCFITHSHVDHNKYIKDFRPDQLIEPVVNEREEYLYSSFPVPHAVLNNGYVLNYDGEQIIYITDCGDYEKINKKFPKATVLMIECNWDYFLIKQQIMIPELYSSYSFSKEGHMSNLDCLNLIAKLEIPATCKILFMHKSTFHADMKNTYKMFDSLPNKKLIATNGTTIFAKSWKMI